MVIQRQSYQTFTVWMLFAISLQPDVWVKCNTTVTVIRTCMYACFISGLHMSDEKNKIRTKQITTTVKHRTTQHHKKHTLPDHSVCNNLLLTPKYSSNKHRTTIFNPVLNDLTLSFPVKHILEWHFVKRYSVYSHFVAAGIQTPP